MLQLLLREYIFGDHMMVGKLKIQNQVPLGIQVLI